MKRIDKLTAGLIIGLVMYSLGAFAQGEDKFSWGFKAGINNSNIYDAESNDFLADNRIGFAGGAYFSMPFNAYVGLQPEILFSQKGFQGQGTFFGQPYTYSYVSNHIDVPVLFQVKPIPQLTLLVGPQYSYLVSDRETFSSDFYSRDEYEEYATNNIAKNRMGINVGLDLNMNNIVVSPRAVWDLQENHGDGTSSTPRFKNRYLQLTLGLRF